jgi:hypothetical protein
MAGLDAKEELDFSDRLIKLNPSNYSAWHYRGTLLQRMHQEAGGDTATKRLLDDNVVAKELKVVRLELGIVYNTSFRLSRTFVLTILRIRPHGLTAVGCARRFAPKVTVDIQIF